LVRITIEKRCRAQEIAIKRAERERAFAVRRDLFGFGDLEEFDVAILQLHNAVVGAPWMAVARADSEAGAAVEFAGRVEIADGMHDMIEAVGHRGNAVWHARISARETRGALA